MTVYRPYRGRIWAVLWTNLIAQFPCAKPANWEIMKLSLNGQDYLTLNWFSVGAGAFRGANPVSSLEGGGDNWSNFTKICNLTSLGYDFL